MPPLRKRRVVSPNRLSDSVPGDAGPFSKGSILRVKLRNFMTYFEIELKAGPYLNMVLGPNGTGKSALVCAMIVGLAGDASTTGRAGTMGEYVKFGCDFATTEIELYNPGQNYVIERKIILKGGRNSTNKACTSEWKINNRVSNQTEVKALITSLNIRVNNLCQFLPQERVVEFCRMNKQQLLENTEKAAGDENMFRDHENLENLSEEIKTLQEKKIELEKQLNSDEVLRTRMSEEVERVREWKKYGEKLSMLNKKKPWLKYLESMKRLEEAQNALEDLERILTNKKKKNSPLEKKVETARRLLDESSKTVSEATTSATTLNGKLVQLRREMDTFDDEVTSIMHDLESKKDAEEKRLKDIEVIKEQITLMKEKLESTQEVDVSEDLKKLSLEVEALMDQMRRTGEKKENISTRRDQVSDMEKSLRGELSRIDDTFRQKMYLLQRKSPQAYRASQWLQENRDRFKGNVYLPILTQINVIRPEWVAVVETSIAFRDLTAFVCEDVDDFKQFSHAMREKNLRVNIVQAPPPGSVSEEPNIPLERLKRYGFSHYLVELFTAPPAIMRYLCRSFNLPNIPVGGENVNSDEFLNCNMNFSRFFCGQTVYSVSVSKYDNQKVSSMDTIKNPDLLSIIVDEDRKLEIKDKFDELRQELNNYDNMIKKIDEELEEQRQQMNFLNEKKRELVAKQSERKRLEHTLNGKQEAIIRKEREKIDLAKEQEIAGIKMDKSFGRRIEVISNVNKILSGIVAANRKKIQAEISKRIAIKREKWYKILLEKANSEFESLETQIRVVKMERDNLKKETQEKHLTALQEIGTREKELPPPIRKKFQSLPNTLEEIDSEIRQLTLRVESMGLSNADLRVLEEFEKTAGKVENYKREIDKLENDLKVKSNTLEATKRQWLPPLLALIERINQNFSKFMGRLNCAGEVSLAKGENENDFQAYGICIKVKYRDAEQLKELSAFHQSGGERSVATMIYMIALQELTKVPFRIVDEINQGMDDTNERKVFDLIVETASSNSSQYFLFSPKLLQGLNYTDRMHIHIIFNGPKLMVDKFEPLSTRREARKV